MNAALAWLADAAQDVAVPSGEHDALWLIGILIVAAPGIIAAIAALLNRRDGRAIKSQVVNGHEDPLRKDLDRVLDKLNDVHDTLTDHGGRLNSIEASLRRKHGLLDVVQDLRAYADVDDD